MGLAKACFRPFRGGDRVVLLSPIGLVYKETTDRPEKAKSRPNDRMRFHYTIKHYAKRYNCHVLIINDL